MNLRFTVKTKQFILITLLVVGFVMIGGIDAMAQAPGPTSPGPTGSTGTGGGPPPCWPPPCIPIDGGLSFLMLGGLAFGGKKAYDFKKNREENKA